MSEKTRKTKSYIANQERFSPSSVSQACTIELALAISLCEEYAALNKNVKKFYQLMCPECGSFVRGMTEGDLGRVEEVGCEECSAQVEVTNNNLEYYFLNEVKKKNSEERESISTEEYINTPLWIDNEVGKSPSQKFLSDNRQMVWHISDLHIINKPGLGGHGHAISLKDEFLNLVSKRNNFSEDIIVISGDCTDDGSRNAEKAFLSFVDKIVNIGMPSSNILLVPGNHDAWNGFSRIRLAFSYLKSEKKQFDKFRTYPIRKLPKPLNNFANSASSVCLKRINGVNYEFVLINTTIPGEMARGIFPTSIDRLEHLEGETKRIAVMHHHLIDDLNSTTLDFENFKKKNAMRVYNSDYALEFLTDNYVSMSLHGHNHFQYHKIEHKINSQYKWVHLVSAPSLMENSYDDVNGNIKDNNYIGFNLIIPEKENFQLFFYRLKKFKYVLEHHVCLRWS